MAEDHQLTINNAAPFLRGLSLHPDTFTKMSECVNIVEILYSEGLTPQLARDYQLRIAADPINDVIRDLIADVELIKWLKLRD